MIDLHSHLIPNIDDGSGSLEKSIEMLETEKKAGVSDIVCTPHFRLGCFETPIEEIMKKFNLLKNEAEKLGINLYLGQEIAMKRLSVQKVSEGGFLTLANSKYILLEFDYNNYDDISDICYNFSVLGFVPIVAHVERYSYVSQHDVEDIIEAGGLIQINASSVCEGLFGHYRKKVEAYLKKDLVHFVASDFHSYRKFELQKAYSIVKKKFGEKRAQALFEGNARCVINNEELSK